MVDVSIITVALNAAKDLPLTFESVLAQDHPSIEYLVLDGESWDGSAEIYRRYRDRIGAVETICDAGIYHAMNDAARRAQGDYILFMNAGDMFYSDDAVSKLFQCMEPGTDIVYGSHVYVRGRESYAKRSMDFGSIREMLREGSVSHRWHAAFPCHQATMTRRSLLCEMPYDTRLQICADHDLLLRAYDAGASFQYVDQPVAIYTAGGYSASLQDRCTTEWNHVYRTRSRRPDLIDSFFGIDPADRADPQSQQSGLKMGGFFPSEGPYPELDVPARMAWCSGASFQLMTPLSGEYDGLVLRGANGLDGQMLNFIAGDQELATAPLPIGQFEISVKFATLVGPSQQVDVVPSKGALLSPTDRRFASMSLERFTFTSVSRATGPLVKPGMSIAFTAANAQLCGQILGGGWSDLEAEHVWSIGACSTLAVRPASDVSTLVLKLRANPHVPADLRTVTIDVNGQPQGTFALDLGDTQIAIPVDAAGWKPRVNNIISLRPGATGAPAGTGDTRNLGLSLHSLEAA